MSDEEVSKSDHGATLRLSTVGRFMVVSDSGAFSPPPQIIVVHGVKWYRFMDIIYCPKPFGALDPDEVQEVCELRLSLQSVVIDAEQYAHVTQQLLQTARLACDSARSVLDFGTGDGRLLGRISAELGCNHVCGCDMSFNSLLRNEATHQAVLVSPNGPLPFRSGSFDLVIASFVFHFAIPIEMLVELSRVCAPGGQLVATIYGPIKDKLGSLLERGKFRLDECEANSTYPKHSVFRASPCSGAVGWQGH